MPKSERTVLSLYYYEELNLREIGEVMDMHLSRIAQLRTQAILRLRSHLERVGSASPGEKYERRNHPAGLRPGSPAGYRIPSHPSLRTHPDALHEVIDLPAVR